MTEAAKVTPAPRPRLTREEWSERFEAAHNAAADCAAAMIAEMHRPRGFTGKRKWEKIVLAMVLHGETDLAIKCSTDGNAANARWMPKKMVTINYRVGTEFLLVIMPACIAVDRNFTQASIPALSDAVVWTDERRDAWKSMRRQLDNVRKDLATTTKPAGQRGRYSYSRSPGGYNFSTW